MQDSQPAAEGALKEHSLPRLGEVYSYTRIVDAPAGFREQAPYYIAMIQLDGDAPMVTAQLTDMGGEEPHIGLKVEMVTRKLRTDGERGMIVYGYKFRPLLKP